MNRSVADVFAPERMTPDLALADPRAAHWVAQAILRLRRETAWCWRQRSGAVPAESCRLPPASDPAQDSLDLVRFAAAKAAFFRDDPAARYLSERIDLPPAPVPDEPVRGSWSWLAGHLGLTEAEEFLLGFAMAARIDSAIGPVCAACLDDRARPFATLALAQRLWPVPLALIGCAEGSHPLYRFGLIVADRRGQDVDWHAALEMPAAVARRWAEGRVAPPAVAGEPVDDGQRLGDSAAEVLALRLRQPPAALEIVPLVGAPGADFEGWAAALSTAAGRRCVKADAVLQPEAGALMTGATLAWLDGVDLFLPRAGGAPLKACLDSLREIGGIPLRLFLALDDPHEVKDLPAGATTPVFRIPPLDFAAREALLKRALGSRTKGMADAIADCAKRFRVEGRTIAAIGATLSGAGEGLDADTLRAAFRSESRLDLGGLAEAVVPRFGPDELVLPPAIRQQFDEIVAAVRNLTEVHYRWGTATAWNECGLAVLFCGVPGTGKTMAAEAMARALDLPMYRIDLSQIVNKYIGETEKNLKRVFDAAEVSDCILFFDEADALFGKRTEVKDSHDRFANIEISYLLQRMEAFKGVAILATNRRKDLDEAFTRRLRYVVEFPVPGIPERERIWRQMFPATIDVGELDFGYLARQFQLTGGHIRSIAFNACLQAAGRPRPPRARKQAGKVTMADLLVAVKRELEKMNRTAGPELFGTYQAQLKELVA